MQVAACATIQQHKLNSKALLFPNLINLYANMHESTQIAINFHTRVLTKLAQTFASLLLPPPSSNVARDLSGLTHSNKASTFREASTFLQENFRVTLVSCLLQPAITQVIIRFTHCYSSDIDGAARFRMKKQYKSRITSGTLGTATKNATH